MALGSSSHRELILQRTLKGRVGTLLAERTIIATLFLCASVAVLATLAIFATFLINGWEFFQTVQIDEFLLGREWAPDFLPAKYGALPLIKGTFLIGLGAAALGVPVGVGTALYLSEFATDRVRRIAKPAIELLAGIPSIIFGLIAIFVISPWLSARFGTGLYTGLAATLMLAIMVLPIITTLSEDAIRAVPREIREGALALGSTKWETSWGVVVPAAASGISAATILGFSRAIGETMIVTLAAGLIPTMSLSYLEPSQTITAFIANRAGGDLPTGSIPYRALFAIGLVLFLLTFVINLVAEYLLARQRRKYS